MREIDGAHGEGGGQLLRTAVALAAITGQTILVRNIRAKRANPGLAPQHLAAVAAVAALCGAEVEGLAVKSREIVFRPGTLRGGSFEFPVGTAGTVTLVLQAALPVAIASAEAVEMHISGGTDIRSAPPLDYFRYVLRPLLEKMGVKSAIKVLRRGYYPRGGGEIQVEVQPSVPLQGLTLDTPGRLAQIRGFSHVANLPSHIAQRMAASAAMELIDFPQPLIEQATLDGEKAIGAGGGIVLAATMERTVLGSAATAQKGVPAEQLGMAAGHDLREELACGATLDVHAADQILIYLAMAIDGSCFVTRYISTHASTTMWLLEQFLPVRFAVTQLKALALVEAKKTCPATIHNG